MASLLTSRRWQRELRRGNIKRNSRAMKPAIWIFQRMKIRELEEKQAMQAFQSLRRVR